MRPTGNASASALSRGFGWNRKMSANIAQPAKRPSSVFLLFTTSSSAAPVDCGLSYRRPSYRCDGSGIDASSPSASRASASSAPAFCALAGEPVVAAGRDRRRNESAVDASSPGIHRARIAIADAPNRLRGELPVVDEIAIRVEQVATVACSRRCSKGLLSAPRTRCPADFISRLPTLSLARHVSRRRPRKSSCAFEPLLKHGPRRSQGCPGVCGRSGVRLTYAPRRSEPHPGARRAR